MIAVTQKKIIKVAQSNHQHNNIFKIIRWYVKKVKCSNMLLTKCKTGIHSHHSNYQILHFKIDVGYLVPVVPVFLILTETYIKHNLF